ncbi:cobaltochelatase subunit CobN [Jiella endophytica]|uniref:cobaltochelatase subunit CobN n=1 Tax=Jiella endophytica TaxID=2558362 RepID=UPI0014317971|nr:cobaltochelatase subunit CobN [Jiella endophytica]
MHLLLAQKGTIDDGGEAVDLGQSPGEIVFLSAADTEIAALAAAAHRLDLGPRELRLANLLRLKHPMSVDTYVSRTLGRAKLVVVRLLGGAAYWPYGLDALLANAQGTGGLLAVIPGDDKPDPGLDAYTTIPLDQRDRLWRFLIEGGPANAEGFLLGCRAVLGTGEWPGAAAPLLKAGVVPSALSEQAGYPTRDGGAFLASAADEHPPLACQPSPPQGGRSAAGNVGLRSERLKLPEKGFEQPADASIEGARAEQGPISPLEGEMPGRADGGNSAKVSNPVATVGRRTGAAEQGPISPLEGEMSGGAEGGPGDARRGEDGLEWIPGQARDDDLCQEGDDEPGQARGEEAAARDAAAAERPLAAIVCYRALVQSGQTGPIEALARAMAECGLDVLPVYVSSLKDPVSVETLRGLFSRRPPDVVVNLTGFAVSSPAAGAGAERVATVLEETGAVVLQGVLASGSEEGWNGSSQGLSARDLAMNVALPELDGRVLTRAIAFKSAGDWDALTETDIVAHRAVAGRVRFVAELATRWARLRRKPNPQKRVAILLANYPNRDGRLGNGVGLDTPAGTVEVLRAMQAAGYPVETLPENGNALIDYLMAGPTNAGTAAREIREVMPLDTYRRFFDSLPEELRSAVTDRWGPPEGDPFVVAADGKPAFALPLARFGDTLVGIQPARGYNIDPKETYHSPDLVPPHNYLALYAFLRETCDAVVHMGKHGNLEWLPGKALALSERCFPEAVFGPMPHLYPFIVNDPGEGTQAKRRTSAVIIDHLTPPLTRAETYGPLKDLEALVDEYYEAAGGDPRRLALLKTEILDLVRDIGLDQDAGIVSGEADDSALTKLDAYLCDLKEMQIRDGLHVFGVSPDGRLLHDLVAALARLPRGSRPGDASLMRALAADLGLCGLPSGVAAGHPPLSCRTSPPQGGRSGGGDGGVSSEKPLAATDSWENAPADVSSIGDAAERGPISPLEGEMPGRAEGGSGAEVTDFTATSERGDSAGPGSISPLEGEMSGRTEGGNGAAGDDSKSFDPLDCDMAAPWEGPRPQRLADLSTSPWRTVGDTVERLESLAVRLIAGEIPPDVHWISTRPVLDAVETELKPAVIGSGPAEIAGLLEGLAGRFVAPGPSGAPTRGRPDVLPTGRNFYSVDTRAVPTETAWRLGRKSAELLVTRHLQDQGEWPTSLGLTAWGTSNMRTGGDDIAQGLALVGAKPVWDRASRRVTGYEIVTLAELGRPRIDVTLRISGFFRDAFPDQIALFDRAVRAVGALEEDEADNPIAARMRRERAALIEAGADESEAERRAGFRVFGSKPGAYGAGLQALIDEKGWDDKADLAESYLVWGSYAYGADAEGTAERGMFEERLSGIEAVVQNQDNREHDLLDSDDYYQFEGGMTAAVEHLSGARPVVYHNDHSRPERPVVRTLEEEIGRVVRARVVNPKWIAGVMRHGYKGAFEIAATVDYMFAFAATTGAVRDHHFEAAWNAFVMDDHVRAFLEANNPAALGEIRDRFAEAIERGLWSPRSNSARAELRT